MRKSPRETAVFGTGSAGKALHVIVNVVNFHSVEEEGEEEEEDEQEMVCIINEI